MEDGIDYDAIGKKIKDQFPDAYPNVPLDMLGQRYASKYGVPNWAKKPNNPFGSIGSSPVTGSTGMSSTAQPQAPKTAPSGYTSQQYAADLKRDVETTGGKNAAYLKQYYDAVNAKGAGTGAGAYLNKSTQQKTTQSTQISSNVGKSTQQNKSVAKQPVNTKVTGKSSPSVQPYNKSFLQQAGEFITGGAGQVFSQIGGALDSALPGGGQTAKTQESIKNAQKMSKELVKKAQATNDPNEKKRLLDLSRQVNQHVGEVSNQMASNTQQAIGTPVSPGQAAIKTATGVGSLLTPVGRSFSGVVGRGAQAGGMYAASQGNTPGESAQNVPGGAATGAIASSALYGAGKAVGAGVNAIKGIPGRAAQGVTKATPTAWAKGMTEHGVDVNKLAQKYIPSGSNYEKVLGTTAEKGRGGVLGQRMQEAESVIQATAKAAGNNVRISGDDIIKALKQEAKLISRELGGDRRAAALKEIIKQAERKYAKGVTVKAALTDLRTANEKFGKSVIDVDAGDAVVNAAQKLEANTLRSTLKKMFPELADALDTQSEIFTLRPILQKAMGTQNTPGSTIRSGSLKNLDLSKPATWFTAIPEAMLSNPEIATKVMNAGSSITNAGNRVAGALPPIVRAGAQQVGSAIRDIPQKVAGLAGGAVGANLIPNGSNQNNNTNNYQPELPTGQNDPSVIQQNIQPDIHTNSMSDQEQNVNQYSSQELYNAYMEAQTNGDTEAASQLADMYNMAVENEKNSTTTGKPLSGPNAVLVNKADSAIKSVDRIISVLEGDPSALVKKLNPLDQQGRQLGADIVSAIDILGYFRTGAAITADQRKDYIYMFPSILDDESTIKAKMQRLKEEFEGYKQGVSQSGGAQEYQQGYLPPIQ